MDRRIYEFVDGWAAYFQTKRGWNLARGKVWCAFACLILSLAFANSCEHGREVLLLINGFWFGIVLWGNILIFREEGDYAESVRKREQLNAKAQFTRDDRRISRIIWLNIFAFVVCIDLAKYIFIPESRITDLIWTAWGLAITLDNYLDCCFYLGPGQHSRELNKKEAAEGARLTSGH